jgi:hypothetical protein
MKGLDDRPKWVTGAVAALSFALAIFAGPGLLKLFLLVD